MGVCSCDRNGCCRIMCDRYSRHYGFLCDECFEELISLGIRTDIEEFMDSEKSGDPDPEEAIRFYFDKIFPTQEIE